MNTKSYKKSALNEEQGAVLALVVIVLMVIIAYFSFVVDIGMLTTSREQVQHFARFAALNAVEAYFNTDLECDADNGGIVSDTTVNTRNCSLCERYQIAINKVNELSGVNNIVANMDKFGEIPRLVADTSHSSCNITVNTGDENVAQLIPGRMSNIETECTGAGRTRTPCFLPVQVNDNPDTSAPTAFMVNGDYYRSAATFFSGRIFNRDSFDLAGSAVATLTPRRGCFVVDISASSIRNTHQRFRIGTTGYQTWLDSNYTNTTGFASAPPTVPTGAWGNEFAYFLQCGGTSCVQHPITNPAFSSPRNKGQEGSWSGHDRTWEYLNYRFPTRPAGPTINQSQQHYAEDYVLKYIFGDNDYSPSRHPLNVAPDDILQDSADPNVPAKNYSSGSPNGRWAHVDLSFLKPSPPYSGPEPLSAILTGVRTAMAEFQKRQVAGDSACIIFYDADLAWPRVFKLTNNFAGLSNAISFSQHEPGILQPDDPAEAPFQDAGPGLETFIRHGLFPRYPSKSHTNTRLALAEAMNQLNTPTVDDVETADFIVHIGDGLSTCPANGSCSNVYPNYVQSMADIKSAIQEVWDDPDEINIPIHVIMVGNDVGPHSVDVNDPDGDGCLSPSEIRTRGYSAVRGNEAGADLANIFHFPNNGTNGPFYQANVDWYDIARFTRGLWAPIRPVDTSEGCTPVTDSDGDLCDDQFMATSGSRRRTFDPWCRPPVEQIITYMEEILGENPYRLVEAQ